MISFEDAISYHVNETEGRAVEDGLGAVVLAIAALRLAKARIASTYETSGLTTTDLIRHYAADFWEAEG